LDNIKKNSEFWPVTRRVASLGRSVIAKGAQETVDFAPAPSSNFKPLSRALHHLLTAENHQKVGCDEVQGPWSNDHQQGFQGASVL